MKRFLVFGFDSYYPSGGARDFLAAFDTLNQALEGASTSKASPDLWDHVEIAELDLETGKLKIVRK